MKETMRAFLLGEYRQGEDRDARASGEGAGRADRDLH